MVLLRHPKKLWISGVAPGDWQNAGTRVTTPAQNIFRRTKSNMLFAFGSRFLGAGAPFCKIDVENDLPGLAHFVFATPLPSFW